MTGLFIYAASVPHCKYGVFLAEDEVEKVIKEVHYYKYYEELCCVYHAKVY